MSLQPNKKRAIYPESPIYCMSAKLLEEFIKMIVSENPLARVPTQLLPPETSGQKSGHKRNKEVEVHEEENLEEFSGVGAIAGYTLPLGMNPDAAGRRKNRPRRKK